jgi:hypothetical protein
MRSINVSIAAELGAWVSAIVVVRSRALENRTQRRRGYWSSPPMTAAAPGGQKGPCAIRPGLGQLGFLGFARFPILASLVLISSGGALHLTPSATPHLPGLVLRQNRARGGRHHRRLGHRHHRHRHRRRHQDERPPPASEAAAKPDFAPGFHHLGRCGRKSPPFVVVFDFKLFAIPFHGALPELFGIKVASALAILARDEPVLALKRVAKPAAIRTRFNIFMR